MGGQARNGEISSSADDSSDEEFSDKSISSLERHRQSEMPSESSDSDSTNIEKPVKPSSVIAKNINFIQTVSSIKPISKHEETEDSSEESSGEPPLSMSLLQRRAGMRSPEKSFRGVLTSVEATSQNVAGVPANVSVQRKGNPEISETEPESESEPEPNDLAPEAKHESSSPTRVPDKTAGENSFSENSPLNTTQSNSVALQQHYTRISSPAFNIPEGSCVWLLQVPRDVPSSHLIGQHLPTELSGGEKIGLSSSPLLIQEQPSEQSKRSLNCMVSTGESTYKLQIVHPNGFWTLRRLPVRMSEHAAEHPWGVPIAPVPIEELLKIKSKKKLPSMVIQERHSNSKKHHLSGLLKTEETAQSLSPEKHKTKKKKKSKHEINSLGDDTSQMGIVQKSRKRKHSSQNEEGVSPLAKKSKKNLENSFLENNHHSFRNSEKIPSFLSEESGLGERRKEKKKKDKSINSFGSSIPITIKHEVVENESGRMFDNPKDMQRSKKKKKKEKNKSCARNGDLGDLSGSREFLEHISIKSERGLSNCDIHNQVQKEVFKKKKSKGMKKIENFVSNSDKSVLTVKKKKRQST